jgi:large subunit ribosomal protein L21
MYAIVEIAGQQFKVEEGKKIHVHHLEAATDEILEFDRVLLVEDNEKILVGEPVLIDYIVEGKIIDHVKGDKVIVFKKKRKKGYRVKRGHRQNFTYVEITSIGKKGTITREKKALKTKAVQEAVVDSAEIKAEEKKVTGPETSAKKTSGTRKAAKTTKKSEEISDKTVKTVAKKEDKSSKAKKPAEKKEPVKKPAAKKVTKKNQ